MLLVAIDSTQARRVTLSMNAGNEPAWPLAALVRNDAAARFRSESPRSGLPHPHRAFRRPGSNEPRSSGRLPEPREN